MNLNIVDSYVSYIEREFYAFFKIVLRNKYSKKVITPFVDAYVNVRYYHEIDSSKSVIDNINNALKKVYDNNDCKDKELLKNIFALFSFMLYFDDVVLVDDNKKALDYIFQFDQIPIEYDIEMHDALLVWLKRLERNKVNFFSNIDTGDYSVKEKCLKRCNYYATILENVKVSRLYSDYAKDLAFKSEVVKENSLFVLLILLSKTLLMNAISLDYSRRYYVDLPSTLWTKNKKLKRVFNSIDNCLTKKYINLVVDYKSYLNNQNYINNLITEGYSIALLLDDELDESFNDYKKFIVFNHILVMKDSKNYDTINNGNAKNIGLDIVYI